MAKLYTIKEIAERLNKEFGDNPVDYQFTEERVRARIRSARARGVIKPTRMGYDRRTKYYTEEDYQKLKATWIGPELPEFTDYPEDLEIINPDEEEVTVRSAKGTDTEAILGLLPPVRSKEEKDTLRIYVAKMLKSSQQANFVAVLNEEGVVGWAQVEISTGTSLVLAGVTGLIRLYARPGQKINAIALRSLFHRADSWLREFQIEDILVEIPASLGDLNQVFTDGLFLKPETRMLLLTRQ